MALQGTLGAGPTLDEYFNVGSKSCYIGAKPMYCIYSPYVECERGDEFAMQYGLWFSGVPFFIVFFVMLTFTFMIIHSLVLMKQKRDRWSLSSGNGHGNDSSVCFRCLASLVTFPAKVKKLFERNTENASPKSQLQMNSSGPVSQNSLTSKNRKVMNMSNVFENNDEEKQSLSTAPNAIATIMHTTEERDSSETIQGQKTSYKRGDTKDFSFSSSVSEEEEIQLCPELPTKTYVAASRSGNASDPFAFDLRKVRQSIRAEAQNETETDGHLQKDEVNKTKIQSSLRRLSALRTSTNTSLSKEEEAIKHSLTYLFGYFLCYTPILIIGFLQMSRTKYPFVLNIISRCLLTLHGPVFLLTYTRPCVRSIRRNNNDHSWISAFWEVFKSGGDNDS